MPRSVKKIRYEEPPSDANIFVFQTPRGRKLNWRLAAYSSSDDFLAKNDVVGINEKFFNGAVLRVFFPVGDSHVTKTFRGLGKITLQKILQCVEGAATAAAALHLYTVERMQSVTTDDIGRMLQSTSVSHLLLRRVGGGNQVYVRLTKQLRRVA